MSKLHPDKSTTYQSKDGNWSIFYASGSKGQVMRSDGNGGFMARGWYRRNMVSQALHGPFPYLNHARDLSK